MLLKNGTIREDLTRKMFVGSGERRKEGVEFTGQRRGEGTIYSGRAIFVAVSGCKTEGKR